jgi:hypothetical protein
MLITSKGKLYGYNGAAICYDVPDTPPTESDELRHSLLATKTPYTLTFTEAERGKRVYIALAWQNERGQKGRSFLEEQAMVDSSSRFHWMVIVRTK